MSPTKEATVRRPTNTSTGRRIARTAAILAIGAGLAVGTTTAASADDG